MKITLEIDGKIKNMTCGNINFYYGYNSSGKSKIASILYDGFQSKFKNLFLVDGFQLNRTEFDTYFIDGKQNIEEQLKFTSKTILRKYLMNDIVDSLNIENDFEIAINNRFKQAIASIANKIDALSYNDTSVNVNLEVDMLEKLVDDCISITLSKENEPDSNKRFILFNLLFELIKQSKRKTILIMDDFDNYLDDNNIYEMITLISSIGNLSTFLFTCKSSSLQFSFNKFNISCIRNSNIFNLTDIKSLIISSLYEDTNIEDALDYQLIFEQSEIDSYIKKLHINISNTLGRILTNKTYSINGENAVNIVTNNDLENKFLSYVSEIIQL